MLDNILAHIKELKNTSSLWVKDFYACSPFTVVELNDGSIGSAGNYDVQNQTKGYRSFRVKEEYSKRIAYDPLLMESLGEDQTWVGLSLRVAILSALSQSLLNAASLEPFGLTCTPVVDQRDRVEQLLKRGDTVSLMGFGGGFDTFCASDLVKRLYVCDFMFEHEKYREIAWQKIRYLNGDQSRVTLVDGTASNEIISLSDVCFITGSALCNGTMETLLTLARQCREVIVQGPSCSLWPTEFFRRSVTLVLTTIKSISEFEAGMVPGNRVYEFSDRNYVAISGACQSFRRSN